MDEELQRTSLYQYVPFVLVTTLVLVALPLLLAYTLSGPSFDFPFLLITVICTAVSVTLGKVGASLWQHHPEPAMSSSTTSPFGDSYSA